MIHVKVLHGREPHSAHAQSTLLSPLRHLLLIQAPGQVSALLPPLLPAGINHPHRADYSSSPGREQKASMVRQARSCGGQGRARFLAQQSGANPLPGLQPVPPRRCDARSQGEMSGEAHSPAPALQFRGGFARPYLVTRKPELLLAREGQQWRGSPVRWRLETGGWRGREPFVRPIQSARGLSTERATTCLHQPLACPPSPCTDPRRARRLRSSLFALQAAAAPERGLPLHNGRAGGGGGRRRPLAVATSDPGNSIPIADPTRQRKKPRSNVRAPWWPTGGTGGERAKSAPCGIWPFCGEKRKMEKAGASSRVSLSLCRGPF